MDILKNINIKGSFDRFDESRFFSPILGFSDSAKILGENLEQQQLKAIHEFQPLQQPMFRHDQSTSQPIQTDSLYDKQVNAGIQSIV